MPNLDAKIDLDDALIEIHILIESATSCQDNMHKYATYNKAAIVLLCGKFEAFLESFLEEYAYVHLQRNNNKTINPSISEHIIEKILKDIDISRNNKTKRNLLIDDLVKLCGPTEVDCSDFKVNTSFSYGKHGQKEVTRLLKCFGFDELVDEEDTQAFFIKFNSLNNIRNNILHQDSTPSLTHQDVEEYMKLISIFAEKIDSIAQEML